MRIKMSLSLSVGVMMLFGLSLTSYATEINRTVASETNARIAPEDRRSNSPVDESKPTDESSLGDIATKNLAAVELNPESGVSFVLPNPNDVTLNEDPGTIEVDPSADPLTTRAATKGSLVGGWLEARANEEEALSREIKNGQPSHYLQKGDEKFIMGGGWCDWCGCWLHHGYDPNGTPQEQIGHPYVCTGGANSQNCWSHYYSYCVSSR